MTTEAQTWQAFPAEVRVDGEDTAVIYRKEDDCYVVHGGRTPQGGAAVEVVFDEAGLKVVPGAWPSDDSSARITAVYRLQPHGPLAAPTGLLFVRMRDGRPLESGRDDFESAGYRICEILSFAPHAGWLAHLSGDVAAALSGADALRKVPGVVRVEPQMLIEAQKKA